MTAPRSSPRLGGTVLAAALGGLVLLPAVVSAQDGDGFEGYIQTGTCASPTDDVRVELDSESDHDVEPYLAKPRDGGDPVTLGYYGSAAVPGFSVSTISSDIEFSLFVEDAESGDPVACGEVLVPTEQDFTEVGVAVVRLSPMEGSEVEGVAVLQRSQLERELDVTPARARILLTTDPQMAATEEPAEAYDGYVQAGTCESPSERLKVDLATDDDAADVTPYLAEPSGSEDETTVAFYGSALMPGYALASTYTDQNFSLALTEADSDEPVACGDILEPDSGDWTDAGLQLVQLLPVGDGGVPGYAVLQRIGMQRELDVTPTRTTVVLFTPPTEEVS